MLTAHTCDNVLDDVHSRTVRHEWWLPSWEQGRGHRVRMRRKEAASAQSSWGPVLRADEEEGLGAAGSSTPTQAGAPECSHSRLLLPLLKDEDNFSSSHRGHSLLQIIQVCKLGRECETYWMITVFHINITNSVQFSSVALSCPTLCDAMNSSTAGLPVHHQVPESTQTHVHCVSDAIQPSHPLLSPSPPALNLSQHQGLFQWVSSLHQVAKVLEFQLQHQSLQWTPRTDLLKDGLVGAPCTPRDSQESSPIPQFKSINSSALSFLYSPTLTSIHDHWKNHSLD